MYYLLVYIFTSSIPTLFLPRKLLRGEIADLRYPRRFRFGSVEHPVRSFDDLEDGKGRSLPCGKGWKGREEDMGGRFVGWHLQRAWFLAISPFDTADVRSLTSFLLLSSVMYSRRRDVLEN